LRLGDENGLFELYENLFPLLMVFGRNLGYSHEDCRDQVQQLFMELWEKRKVLPPVEKIKAYLLTSFKRKLLKEVLKQHRAKTCVAAFANNDVEITIAEEMILAETTAETYQQLAHRINTLAGRQKQLLQLRFYEGLSYEQIQQVTGLSPQTVYNKIHEALKKLRLFYMPGR
jgi:RNA polymerase sigma factor (sigma-70 family)